MVMEWGREEEENAGQLHIFTPSQEQKMRKHPEMWELQVTLNISYLVTFQSSPDNTASQQSSLSAGNGGYISNQAPVKCCILGERREGNQQQEPPPWLGE